MDNKTIGKFVRSNRNALGYTTAFVANSIGISEVQYKKYEAGLVNFDKISASRMASLCKVLNIDIDEFIRVKRSE